MTPEEILSPRTAKLRTRIDVARRLQTVARQIFRDSVADQALDSIKGKVGVFSLDDNYPVGRSVVEFNEEHEKPPLEIMAVNLAENCSNFTLAHELGHVYHCVFFPYASATMDTITAESIAIFVEMQYAMKLDKKLDRWIGQRYKIYEAMDDIHACSTANCISTWPNLGKLNVNQTIERIIQAEGVDPICDLGGLLAWQVEDQVLQ